MLLAFHAGYALAVAGLALLFELIDSPPGASGFDVGICVGALPVFWILFRDALGLAHRSMGAEAERWTASELSKLSEVARSEPVATVGSGRETVRRRSSR